jgi:thioredoxin reductase
VSTSWAFDVVVVGGGPAGLSAALVLGRARRHIVIVDSGEPRDSHVSCVHNVFTRDGATPADLLEAAQRDLAGFSSVVLQRGRAVDVSRRHDYFETVLSDGACLHSRALLLAYGVVDELPPIEGLRQLWGHSALHCPYCHGWELRNEPLAVYGRGDEVIELVRLVRGWSANVTLCTNGGSELADDQIAQLSRWGVAVREDAILRFDGIDGVLQHVTFTSGRPLPCRAVFLQPTQRPRCDFAARLRCAHTPVGLVRTDSAGQTSVESVWAAGDIVNPIQQVIFAAASGVAAGIDIHGALLKADFPSEPK